MFMPWEPKFKVGIAAIDADHEHIFNIISRLNDAIEHGCGMDVLNDCLYEITDSIGCHFEREEILMQHHALSSYGPHKEEHDGFLVALSEQIFDVERGAVRVDIDTLAFLQTWLINHTQVTDRQTFAELIPAQAVALC